MGPKEQTIIHTNFELNVLNEPFNFQKNIYGMYFM